VASPGSRGVALAAVVCPRRAAVRARFDTDFSFKRSSF
jgi:hypothetical protein